MKYRYCSYSMILLFVPFTFFAQVSEKEKDEAVTRAKEFSQQLRRTQDIQSLLPSFFAGKFLDQIKEDSGHNTLILLDLSEKQKERKIEITDSQRQRFYFASQNWFYLAWLYNCWRDPKQFRDDDAKFALSLPPGVKKELQTIPLFRLIFLKDTVGDSEFEKQIEKAVPKNASDVEYMSLQLEKINSLYRSQMGPLRNMSDKRFDETVGKCDEDEEFYSVSAASCNDKGNCPGVPKGVSLIGVKAPVFDFIDFARVDGELKIVRLFLWDESLK